MILQRFRRSGLRLGTVAWVAVAGTMALTATARAAVPEEARTIRTPEWARLDAVLGTFDPPFVAEAPRDTATSAAFIDDRMLLILAGDGRLRVWDRLAHVTRLRSDACRVVFQPSAGTRAARNDYAETVAVGSEHLAAIAFGSGRVCIVDLVTGRKTVDVEAGAMHDSSAPLLRIRFGSGRLVTFASQARTTYETVFKTVEAPETGGDVRWWDPRSGRKLAEVHVGALASGAISPDGEHFVAASDKLRLFDRTGRMLWATDDRATHVEFARPEILLATDGDRLWLMAARDGSVRARLTGTWGPGGEHRYGDLAITPDGHLAITRFDRGDNRTIVWDLDAHRELIHRADDRFWPLLRKPFIGGPDGNTFWTPQLNVVDARALQVVDGPSDAVQCVAISEDAQHAVACGRSGRDRVFRVWDLAGGQEQKAWSGDIGFVTLAGTAALVQRRSASQVLSWPDGALRFEVARSSGSLSADGSRIALLVWNEKAKAYSSELRDTTTGKVLWRNDKVRFEGDFIAFAPDGRRLLVRTRESQLVELDVRDGKPAGRTGLIPRGTLQPIDEHWALMRGPNGGVSVYDLQERELAWRTAPTGTAVAVAAIPGRPVFVRAEGSKIRLHWVANGEALPGTIDLDGNDDAVSMLAAARRSADGGPVLLVGTKRGVVLRFALRLAN